MFVTANYPSAPVIKLAGIIIKHYSHLPIKDLDLLNVNDQDIKRSGENSLVHPNMMISISIN